MNRSVLRQQNNFLRGHQVPSIRLKEDTLKHHSCTSGHLSAIQIELTQKKSPFHKDYIDKEESITSTYERVFATAYFLMKEYIANRKLLPVINSMEKIIGVSELSLFIIGQKGV